jgi:hypothetical protein
LGKWYLESPFTTSEYDGGASECVSAVETDDGSEDSEVEGDKSTFLVTRASHAFLAADCSASFFDEQKSSPTYL